MTPLTLRTAEGIAVADRQACFIEPVWRDPDDDMESGATNFEGDGVKTELATLEVEGRTRWSQRFTYAPRSQAEMKEFFDYTQYWHGRARSFWLPSWRTDFNLLTDVSPTTGNLLTVQKSNFQFFADRYGLMIQSVGNVLDVFKISGYDSNYGRLLLSTNIDVSIPLQNIRRVSLIRRVRCDQDFFEWVYKNVMLAEIGVSFIEVPNEAVFQ